MPAPSPSRPAHAEVVAPAAPVFVRSACVLAAAALALCAGTRALPAQGAPVAPAAAIPAAAPAEPDVRFMRQMIPHHAQALAMAALVPERSARTDVRLAAERIAASQGDEIALMRRWLAARGVAAPADSGAPGTGGMAHMDHASMGHGAPGSTPMPGMLTAEELARLGTLRGAAFDRAFLAGMIRHHEGALAMVAALFGAPGAAQDAEAFRLAADVDADQRAEIARMRRMLAAGPPARR